MYVFAYKFVIDKYKNFKNVETISLIIEMNPGNPNCLFIRYIHAVG